MGRLYSNHEGILTKFVMICYRIDKKESQNGEGGGDRWCLKNSS